MKLKSVMPPLASCEPIATRRAPAARPARPAPPPSDRHARLRWMVDEHIGFVARVLRNAGTPHSEVDDEVQRTFIIVSGRIDDVQPGAERSFLFRVALNVAAHARRTIARRREVSGMEAPERVEALATPEHLTDRKRMRELLDEILSRLHESLRAVFVLYEFEELSMAEIAAVLGVPRGTVASRLRRAREEFREQVAGIEDFWQGGGTS